MKPSRFLPFFFLLFCIIPLLLKAQSPNRVGLDAEDFGVVVNSKIDNSAALQKAIDSAAKLGSTVYLRAGTYPFSKTINLPAGVSINGAGMGASATQAPLNGTVLLYTGDATAIILSGTNSSIRNVAVYSSAGTAKGGIQLLAGNKLVESVSLSNIYIYGFTGGVALQLLAQEKGGVTYCSFYDVRIRHAKTGIEIKEGDNSSFVNSNSFFHGAISGGGFDYGILINGGNNNVFYGTVVEPYTSTYGHLVVNRGQLIGENIRIEAARQKEGVPVIDFKEASALSKITGSFGGGAVLNLGNNKLDLATANYAGETNPGYNEFVNASFLLPSATGMPQYWGMSNSNVKVATAAEEVIKGQKVLLLKVPPGVVTDFYPLPEATPKMGNYSHYSYANFNVLVKTKVSGSVRTTYNYSGGMVSSAAHTGSNNWETLGMQVITNPSVIPAPKININNAKGRDTLLVQLTSPSFNFGLTVPQRSPSLITSNGGIITGTLTTSITSEYTFTNATYLLLPKNGNVFDITKSNVTISRINYLPQDFFAAGTVITLLFNSANNTVQQSKFILLKASFVTTAANTSLTLISNGNGTWREMNRNN